VFDTVQRELEKGRNITMKGFWKATFYSLLMLISLGLNFALASWLTSHGIPAKLGLLLNLAVIAYFVAYQIRWHSPAEGSKSRKRKRG
jgi:hypothetical protein